jgi:uncharacterized protein (DUF58 family)
MQKLNRLLYKVYTSAHPTGRHRSYKLTAAGRLVFAATIAAATFGVDTMRAPVYQLFTLLASALAIAWICTRFFKANVSISRTLPPFATAGEKMRYRVTVQNRAAQKQTGLFLQETPATSCPSFTEFMLAREPGEADRNRWDQMVKYHRFEWLIKHHIRARLSEHALPVLGANSYAHVYLDLEPTRRGYIDLTGLSIRRTGPFGLYKAIRHLPLPCRLLILPRRFPLPPVQLPGTRKHHAGGVTLASSVGNAHEFRSLREYRPGDPMRMLHWKSVAKTGELIIRENEDEYFVRHALILDTFTDQPVSDLFETAVSVAASFACTVRTQESMLDLLFVEDQAHCISTGRGVDHTGKLLKTLAVVEPCCDKKIDALFPLVREHAARISGCICILLAWDDERKELVRILSELDIPLKILVITDDEPTNTDAPIHFIHTAHPEEGLARL